MYGSRIPAVKADILSSCTFVYWKFNRSLNFRVFTFQGSFSDIVKCTEYSIRQIKAVTGKDYDFPRVVCFYHNSTAENQPSRCCLCFFLSIGTVQFTLMLPIDDKSDLYQQILQSPQKRLISLFPLPSLRVAS